jgi:Zn-dependent peptidase ImmA (M78 family)
MKIPKKINIKGRPYKILFIKGLIEKQHAMGICCETKKEIHLDSKLKDEDLKATLLHEIGHAIMFETGLTQCLSHDIQEIVTENFSNVIIDLFHIRFRGKK